MSAGAPGAAVAVDVVRAGRLADYWALGKPRVVALIVVATAAGFWLGVEGRPDLLRLAWTLLGTALAAAGALGLNMLVERDLDARMARTAGRPLPAGRLGPEQALVFGVGTVSAGLAVLSLLADPVAGLVTAVTVASYLFAYTPLKRMSALCTVVGAFPGALPPLTGWAAARGTLDAGAAALFVLFFFWQLPHSLAIARLYREDYRRAGIQVLPAVAEARRTGRQAVLHSLGLVAASFLPAAAGMAAAWTALAAAALGLWMVFESVRLLREDSESAARRLFAVSLVYVPALLVALVAGKLG